MLVATLGAATATPGITALFGSVTVPVGVEGIVWAAGAAAAMGTGISHETVCQHVLGRRVGFAMTDSHRKAMGGADDRSAAGIAGFPPHQRTPGPRGSGGYHTRNQ